MVNRIRVVNSILPGTGEASGIGVLRTLKMLGINLGIIDGSLIRWIPANSFVSKAASFNVLPQDHGKTFYFDSPTSIIAQLPAVTAELAGMEVTFINKQQTAAGGHAISPAAADKILGKGLAKADDADYVNSAASDAYGDRVTVKCDGIDGWQVEEVIGTWA